MRFTAPFEPGQYEVRYQSDGTTGLIARQAFMVVASEISLSVPAEVEAGKPFEISWTGPNGEADYITVVPADASDGTYKEYRYTRDGSPLQFTAPIEAGAYEVRYQSDREAGVFARQAFTVSATSITLEAPDSVMAGSKFEVAWTGPNGQSDYITVVPADSPEGTYKSYRYTTDGSPLSLQAGVEPGVYEVRYQSDRESGVFARIPITITPMEITISAPTEVAAGSSFDVSWTGPNGDNDYITIVEAGASEGFYGDYHYTNQGNPLTFIAPDKAGSYELRYQTDGDGVFYSIPISVK
jgi:Ca-activated chloride channel family protein